jgi:hypothetical protein
MRERSRHSRPTLLQRVTRGRRVRRSDLRDWVQLAVIVVIGLAFVVWWQATHAL